jgi:hypothetical protein
VGDENPAVICCAGQHLRVCDAAEFGLFRGLKIQVRVIAEEGGDNLFVEVCVGLEA